MANLAMSSPLPIDHPAVYVDILARAEGGKGERAAGLIDHFFDDPVERESESIRLAGMLKDPSYIDKLKYWKSLPHLGVKTPLVKRPEYFTKYPGPLMIDVEPAASFKFHDDILTEFPPDDEGKVEFFFSLFSRGADWSHADTPVLMDNLAAKFGADWWKIVQEKATTILMAAILPDNSAALRFILGNALLDDHGHLRPLAEYEDGYALFMLPAMWNAGFCEDFHRNATAATFKQSLESSDGGFQYFGFYQLINSEAKGCWKQ